MYKDAGIQISTNAQLVAGMRFVNGWTVYESQLYTAYGVGVKEADRLAGRGVRNVTLLVELQSRGIGQQSNIWQISVYQSQVQKEPVAMKEPTAPKSVGTDFFNLVSIGTPNQVTEAIKAGADINARDKDGLTPLVYAVSNNQDPEIVTLLLSAGANTGALSTIGSTPLMWAAQFNSNPEVIMRLLKASENMNTQNGRGWTALMYAARFNHNPEIVMTFLKSGADAKVKDSAGKTAFDYAQDNAKLKDTDAYWKLNDARF